jgi:SAM-dependent methyltransferase
MGPVIFTGYAADMARRAAAGLPARVLETAAGTGIVTRALRDTVPISAQLTATDLNVGMLEIAQKNLRPSEQVDFQPADATALPFRDASISEPSRAAWCSATRCSTRPANAAARSRIGYSRRLPWP